MSGTGNDYLNFYLSEDSDRANSAGIGDVAGTNRFGVRIIGDDTSTNTSSQGNTTYTPGGGEVYLLVGRIATDGTSGATEDIFDQIDLWVNPSSSTLGDPTWSSDRSTMLSTSVGFSFFGLQTSDVGSSDDYRIDEFRVGTDVLSVLGVIPEPSSFAAVAGGLALLCGMGRRRVSSSGFGE